MFNINKHIFHCYKKHLKWGGGWHKEESFSDYTVLYGTGKVFTAGFLRKISFKWAIPSLYLFQHLTIVLFQNCWWPDLNPRPYGVWCDRFATAKRLHCSIKYSIEGSSRSTNGNVVSQNPASIEERYQKETTSGRGQNMGKRPPSGKGQNIFIFVKNLEE